MGGPFIWNNGEKTHGTSQSFSGVFCVQIRGVLRPVFGGWKALFRDLECNPLQICEFWPIINMITKKRGIPVKKCTTDTCCLTLPLKLEKWQEDRLAKRFEIARQIYNTLVRAEFKKLNELERTPEYKKVLEQIHSLDWKDSGNRQRLNDLYRERNQILKNAKFTEYGFKSDMKFYYKHFSDNIGSCVAVHGIAPQVWAAFEKYLFKPEGKKVHFKRFGDVHSLRGYSKAGESGGAEITFCGTHIRWKNLELPIKLSPDNAYETEMLSRRVKYVRILRKPGKSKDRWYVQLSLEGKPAIKYDRNAGEIKHPVAHGAVGLDIGPQTLAYSAETTADLVELADQVQNIEQEKRRLQRKMDRSRRSTNPGNYNTDGTIRRGVKLTRNKSKAYCKLQRQLAYLQHTQAETRKRQHTELANYLLSLGDCFYVEEMKWSSLAHRAKETAVSEKTGRFKQKKRFGKSIANKAPSTLIGILQQKCESLGLPGIIYVPLSAKASQYNHLTGEYTPKPLSQRWNTMPDAQRVQRDLYSAFLLQHFDSQAGTYNLQSLQRDYPQFLQYHDQSIRRLSEMPKTLSSMGIRKSIRA